MNATYKTPRTIGASEIWGFCYNLTVSMKFVKGAICTFHEGTYCIPIPKEWKHLNGYGNYKPSLQETLNLFRTICHVYWCLYKHFIYLFGTKMGGSHVGYIDRTIFYVDPFLPTAHPYILNFFPKWNTTWTYSIVLISGCTRCRLSIAKNKLRYHFIVKLLLYAY